MSDIFEHQIRVTWGDCDPARIAYTGRLSWFALDAIHAWWEQHTGGGWYQIELDRNIGMPFVSMKMDFRAPVTPRHPLICKVWPNHLGKTSVGFHVDGLQDQVLCFSGDFVSVFTVANTFTKTQPPEDLRKLLQEKLK